MEPRPHWLNQERLRLYPRLGLLMFILIGAGILLGSNLVNQNGPPLDSDFGIFLSAARLALGGHATEAYDPPVLWQEFRSLTGSNGGGLGNFAWFYPPPFFLAIVPLGLLPYFPAYLLFMSATLAGYLAVLQRIVPGREALWCLAAFSGVWFNFRLGQNGMLTAALTGAALLSLERHPYRAGLFIGLLAIKPHLGLVFPVALIAISAWRTLFMAAFTALALFAVSTALFGQALLAAWWNSLSYATTLTESLPGYWVNMPTAFAFLRLLGTPVPISYAVHFAVAAWALVSVWGLWRHCASWPLRNAALVVATFMASPYLFEYDLAGLALPIAWLAKAGLKDGWLWGERELLVTAWLLPFLLHLIARGFPVHIQIGPWVLMALLLAILRRSRSLPTQT